MPELCVNSRDMALNRFAPLLLTAGVAIGASNRGTNTWDNYLGNSNESQTLEIAQYMSSTLLPFGYDLLTIDGVYLIPQFGRPLTLTPLSDRGLVLLGRAAGRHHPRWKRPPRAKHRAVPERDPRHGLSGHICTAARPRPALRSLDDPRHPCRGGLGAAPDRRLALHG